MIDGGVGLGAARRAEVVSAVNLGHPRPEAL
jgi:hypothetical protein